MDERLPRHGFFFRNAIREQATSIFAELQYFWVHGHGRFQMESISLRSTPHCKFVLKTKMNSLIKKNQIVLLKVDFIFI